ncbi:MAG: hypothetical protein K0B02_03945 [DPANN group archaeon]|nr:hypothetical protein [DPANN group archaeon]
MPNDDANIYGSDNDDYEVVPLTPIRRLEKRLTTVESTRSLGNLERLMDKIIDMVELNQRIVDEMIKANTGLRDTVGILVNKMDSLNDKITNFVNIVADAGKEESEESDSIIAVKGIIEPLIQNIVNTNEKLIKSNELVTTSLSTIDKRLKRLQPGSDVQQSMPTAQPQGSYPQGSQGNTGYTQ